MLHICVWRATASSKPRYLRRGNNKSRTLSGYLLALASWLGICGGIALSTNCVSAQITPDSTLPNNSIVTPSGNTSTIEGGTRAGSNLFHSFEQFSVLTGSTADFNNALDIQNIISRVTGKSISNIDGLIKANGTANLFLINPNGIIFGPNASLNVGGSFLGSTANAIGFGDRGFFSASNPESPSSLLTVNPSALLFNQIQAAFIENNSVADAGLDPSSIFTATGLRVPDRKNLLLVGSDININGGGLYAFGGRVEFGGLAGTGTVGLNGDGNDLRLSFPQGMKRADVSVNNGSKINVVAEEGGSISINAQNLNISGESALLAGIGTKLGAAGSQAGDIEINTTGAVKVAGSYIGNTVESGAVGNSGNISITAESLFVTDGAQLVASNFGQQENAGSVTINADTVSFDGVSSNGFISAALSSVESGAVGNSGNINITARALSITDGAQLQTLVRGVSEDGTLPGGQGNAGNVNINVRDAVSFDGVNNRFPSAAFSSVESGAVGNGGGINITAGSLSVRNGARLNASTSGQGNAGSVTVNVRDWASFDGVGSNGVPSSALSNVEPEAIGNAGGINIRAGSLLVTNGARVESLTRGQGNAGSVTMNADTVSFDGGKSYGQELSAYQEQFRYADENYRWFSGAYTSVEETSSKGEGGNIVITTRSLSVTDGAQVSARSIGSGAAGNLEVSARSIRLDNQASLSSDTIAGQGNIFLRSRDLVLRRGSKITTNATGTATGGNIAIDTDILVALEDSDITANAQEAFGGRVIIDAQVIFRTEDSDITATSELGPEFSGTVELNTPDVDPSSGLVSLPITPVDTQVAQTCTPGGSQAQSEFVVTGRGGLPPNPGEVLSTDAVQVDLVTLNSQVAQPSTTAVSTNFANLTPTPIIEAQGWVIDKNGKVIFTANAPTVTPHNSWQKTANCRS